MKKDMYINLESLIKELEPSKATKRKVLGIFKYGKHEDSTSYIESIERKARKMEVVTIVQDLKGIERTCEKVAEIEKITDYILAAKPFPELLEKKLKLILPEWKDIDNFTSRSIFKNCTAEAVLEILRYLKIEIDKHILIIGRGAGKEIFKILEKNDYTLALAHSKTKNLKKITMNSDVIISCTGVQGLIKKDMVKANSLVIDVGLGDVEEDVARKAHVTPVRNGVGAVTTQVLFKHILEG
ncbi:bifunctional 5,10-methylenetetrahydrofolate dehydrogenase/5,10-methenyltetrahydrofolate cyclohydrolase [Clostridium cochlearium]|uniref:bifunctional 5,10-methylenetetrahydrofolate dehydrogenase/5,10-methenyltetrahydrofolate cyclohydrolase n=1 Tax=Clostridium cochlearium TaxID=1494 RepID=UPI0014594E3F|nr:bifunctional 5,10-methylenetetrahydrofolate dehydrogenase/5,10-methenyltetrahydrofolate cyclohydrolase [Clostridium cochlearium]MBV1816885.1 hypothetical protein [Bacteroidales bacterium MSK.15.36]NSJ90163.1 bifunctional 5,10-methylenetetrahydrofolate dehydrogenase/5,10-methenyltetrahydrofolate cyclohydrolase [Coprococcus sp. MSK.21.13]MCG4571750.1 hypothetical protein [Clostridium cochlearium]MCG4579079.1 hypothetical protein [Clostridium cochlearium]NME95339.1 bifunctional 5,10-methylenet